MSNDITTLEQEGKDLQLHVDLCAQRYLLLEKRLHIVEVKLDSLVDGMGRANNSLKTTIITSAGTIVASLMGLIATLILK